MKKWNLLPGLARAVLLASSLLLFAATGWAQQPIRITCVGNSITRGAGTPNPTTDSYPAQLQALLGNDYIVSNFGVSGTTLLKKGDNPYWQTPAWQKALESRPDIVLLKLGTNDSKLVNRRYLDQFGNDYHALIQSFARLSPRPRIILLLPIPAFTTDSNGIYDPVIQTRIIPVVQQAAYTDSLEVIDLHSLFADRAALIGDKIHPNKEGAGVIARRLYRLIKQARDTAYDLFNRLDLPRTMSSFYGYPCAAFTYRGRDCKIVQPKWAAPGHPWVWRARFWGHEPQLDIALLERGFYLVYCDVVELYGNKDAIRAWDGFYQLLKRAGLAGKTVLEGMSRGGVYVYNWAAANPRKVACVYADNPVLDLKSWPGGRGSGPGSKADWELVKTDYHLTTEQDIARFSGSPMDKIQQIVRGKYPMLHVCGDADEIVPMEENTLPFERKVLALHGDITVIHKPGFRHHPHSLPDPEPIVDFVLKATKQNKD